MKTTVVKSCRPDEIADQCNVFCYPETDNMMCCDIHYTGNNSHWQQTRLRIASETDAMIKIFLGHSPRPALRFPHLFTCTIPSAPLTGISGSACVPTNSYHPWSDKVLLQD